MRLTTSRSLRDEYIWLALNLDQDPRPVSGPPGLGFREISREELERDPARFGVTLSDVRHPVPRRFFAGFLADEVVYRMWVFEAHDHLLGRLPDSVRNAVLPSALAVEGSFTPPALRGRSIRPAALTWLAATARAEGMQQILLETRRTNIASIRGALKAGFKAMTR